MLAVFFVVCCGGILAFKFLCFKKKKQNLTLPALKLDTLPQHDVNPYLFHGTDNSRYPNQIEQDSNLQEIVYTEQVQ